MALYWICVPKTGNLLRNILEYLGQKNGIKAVESFGEVLSG